MRTLISILGLVAVLAFLSGYLTGESEAFTYWARNVFGVALVALIFFVLAVPKKMHDFFAWVSVTFVMLVCWMLTGTAAAGLMPTWLTDGWVQAIAGGVFGVFGVLSVFFSDPEPEKQS